MRKSIYIFCHYLLLQNVSIICNIDPRMVTQVTPDAFWAPRLNTINYEATVPLVHTVRIPEIDAEDKPPLRDVDTPIIHFFLLDKLRFALSSEMETLQTDWVFQSLLKNK